VRFEESPLHHAATVLKGTQQQDDLEWWNSLPRGIF
jgi:hypothetical protein